MTEENFIVGENVFARSYKLEGTWIDGVIVKIVPLNHRRILFIIKTRYVGFFSEIERYEVDIKKKL